MKKGNGYKTKQSELILRFFIQNKERHLIADDVVEHLKHQGTAVGKATVYRHLDKMVEQNIVRKYILGEGASACYQYCGDDEGRHRHYHLKCVSCGTLFHVECDYLDTVVSHVFQDHRFRVDSSKTVLYGQCKACLEQREEDKV